MADYQFKTRQVVNLRWSQEAPFCITLCDFTAALGPNMHCGSHQSKQHQQMLPKIPGLRVKTIECLNSKFLLD